MTANGEQTVIHSVGTKVWVRDDAEGWIRGEVVSIEGAGAVVVAAEDGKQRKVAPQEVPLQNDDTRGVEDMTALSYLHEPGVLWNLRQRFSFDEIYTYTGSILIAVNPFAPLPHMYGTHMMDQYRGADLGDLSPHVYAIADAAYKQMRTEGKGQAILVSGESGAGKTETSKLIMKYLAYMGGYMEANGLRRRNSTAGGRSVEEQVLESNPLLEAFGNAKTVRNNNSSRFGKYVEINFNADGAISGAAIRTYLLERSRVVSVNNPERSYHIFYQLCDGASPEERKRWRLKPASEFHYLNQSTCFEIPGDSNAEEYERTVSAMAKVGIPPEQREAILACVAAVLHLGNVAFTEGRDADSSMVKPGGAAEESLVAAAELLGVPRDGLAHALTTRTRQTPEGPIISPLNVRAATENRDSLAKVIYSKMFDWLVGAINAAIGEDKDCAASVGVLDIYGFESFEFNDLEQFCINLANEKLQQHFNHHVFKQEQAEYEREKIDWSYIEFVDNQDVLDLIEGKMGILDLLDEQCRFPTSTHKDLSEKLYNSGSCKDSARFKRPKLSQTAFTIEHYAGPVTYQSDNFLEKNKDFVVAEHQNLLQASTRDFVREIFPGETEASADGAAPARRFAAFKFNSVGSQFKRQLGELMGLLSQMEPHYIRCIKPNSLNQPALFENANALHQLRCGGVLEAVRISCAGFPNKRPFPDFVEHFWPLAPDLYHRPDMSDRDIASGILSRSGIAHGSGYQLGVSKVFLRAGQMAVLDKQRSVRLSEAATVIQRFARGHLARLHYRRSLNAVITIQAGGRGLLARKRVREMRRDRAALVVQTAWRRHKLREEYKHVYNLVVAVQSQWRARQARTNYERMRSERAATVLQSNWRRFVAASDFNQQRAAATTLQNAWRVKVARNALRGLKTEAREASKLLEDKKALETKLREMEGTLELVQGQRNELRQEVKEAKAALADAERRMADLAGAQAAAVASASAAAAAELEELRAMRDEAQTKVSSLSEELEGVREKLTGEKAELSKKLTVAQDYIQRLMVEKADLDKRFNGMKEELITRLQNACAQRDEARAQVMELEARLQKAAADFAHQQEEARRAVAAAAAAASANGGAPIDVSVIGRMGKGASVALQQLAAQGPGMARMMVEAANTYLAPGTPGAPGTAAAAGAAANPGVATAGPSAAMLAGPEHVPGQPAIPGSRISGPGAAAPETELERRTRELQAKQLALMQERRRQEEERLLAALPQPMGFHKGRPMAALVVFRCCLQWRAFQADRTSVFDRIIHVIGAQIERHQEDNPRLSYWLTNTTTLLFLLQRNIKPASSGSIKGRAAAAGRAAGSMLNSWLGRGASVGGGEASIHGGGVGGFRLVEAKYPALLFKQQLDAFVQKIFPMLRDNVKKAITPLLAHCIHTPRGVSGRTLGPGRRTASGDVGAASAGGAGAAAQGKAWGEILSVLDGLLADLRAAYVPKPLVQALFRQLFAFINVQLFNQLLLRRECCSFSNGEYVKTGLAQVESWIQDRGTEWVGDSWDELKYIRQAVTFLVIGNKPRKTLENITRELCPILSIQQLYRISTMYWDDKYNTETVSSEVLARMKQAMVESSASSAASHSFLLDDDSTLPFSAGDILGQMDDKDLYSALTIPDCLKGDAGGGGGSSGGGSNSSSGGGAGEGSSASSGVSFAFLEKEIKFSQLGAPS